MSPCDYTKYPKNWRKEIVPRILKRAQNKCELCGLENGQKVTALKLYVRSNENGRYGYRSVWFRDKRDAEKTKQLGTLHELSVVLTIAHLDHDEENHDIQDARLRAMCQYCHLQYDSKEKYRRAMLKGNKT